MNELRYTHCQIQCWCRLKARPDIRPTGRIVGIFRQSERRNRIVGVLQKNAEETLVLNPCDARMPQFSVEAHRLPDKLRQLYEVSNSELNALTSQSNNLEDSRDYQMLKCVNNVYEVNGLKLD